MPAARLFSLLPRAGWAALLLALPAALALALWLHPGPLVQLRVDVVPGTGGGTWLKLAFSTCGAASAAR